MTASLRFGRIAGIPVGASWSALLIAGLIAWSLAGRLLPAQVPGLAPAAYWLAGAAGAGLFLGSLLAHELGHALVARRAGLRGPRHHPVAAGRGRPARGRAGQPPRRAPGGDRRPGRQPGPGRRLRAGRVRPVGARRPGRGRRHRRLAGRRQRRPGPVQPAPGRSPGRRAGPARPALAPPRQPRPGLGHRHHGRGLGRRRPGRLRPPRHSSAAGGSGPCGPPWSAGSWSPRPARSATRRSSAPTSAACGPARS